MTGISKKLKGQSQVFIQSLVNRNIGSRTGKDVKAGKKIDKDKDGFDNFEAYWSESDADVTSNTTAHSMFSCQSAGQEKENQSTNHVQETASQPVGVKVNHTARLPSADSYSSQPIGGAAAYYFGHRAIGSRTGKNIKAGKNIRKCDDSFENFENYWSESEPDSILSFHKSVRGNDSKSFISADVPQEEEEENVSAVSAESDSEVIINSKHLSASGVTWEASQGADSPTTQDEVEEEEGVGGDRDPSMSGGPRSEGDSVSEDADTADTDDHSPADKSVMSGETEDRDTRLKDQAESDQCQGDSDHTDHQADQQVTKRLSVDGVTVDERDSSKTCSQHADSVEMEGMPLEQSTQSVCTESSQDNDITGTVIKRPSSTCLNGLSSAVHQEDSAHVEEEEWGSTAVEEPVTQAASSDITHTESSLQSGVESSRCDESINRQRNESTVEEHDGETTQNVSVKEAVPSRRTRSQSRGREKIDWSVRLSGRQTARQRRRKTNTEEEDVTINLSSAKEMVSSIKKSKNKKKKSVEKANATASQVEMSDVLTDNDGDKTKSMEKSKRRRGRRKVTEEIEPRRSKTGRQTGAKRSARKNADQTSQQLDEQGQGIEKEEEVSLKDVEMSLATDEDSKALTDSVDKPKTSQRKTRKSKQSETSTVDEEMEEVTIPSSSKTLQITSVTSKNAKITLKTDRKSKELSETEENDKTEVIKLTGEDNTATVFKLKAVKSTRKSLKTGQEQKNNLKRKSLASNLFPTVDNGPVNESACVSSHDESVDAAAVDSSPENIPHSNLGNDSDVQQSLAEDVAEQADVVDDVCDVDPVVEDKPCDNSDLVSPDSIVEEENTACPEDESNAENEEEEEDVKEKSIPNESTAAPVACPDAVQTAPYKPVCDSVRIQVEVHKEATPAELNVQASSGKSSNMARLNIGGDVTGSICKNTDITGAVSNTPMHSFRTKKRLSYSKVLDDSLHGLEKERQEFLTSGISKDESGSSKQPVRLESVEEHEESDGGDPNTEFISLQPSTRVSMATTDTDSMDENFWIVDEDIKEKKKKSKIGKTDNKMTSRKSSVDSADIDKTETVDKKKPVQKRTEKKSRKSSDVTGTKKSDKKSVKNSSKRKVKKSVSGDETSETDAEQKTVTKNTKRKSISGIRKSGIDASENVEEVNDMEDNTDSPTSTKIRKRKSHDPSNVTVATGGKKSKSARVTKTREVMNVSKKNITVTTNDSMGRLSHLNLAGVGETPKSGVSFRQRRRRTLSESEKTKLNSSCPADLSFSPQTEDYEAPKKQVNKRQSSLSSKPLSPCVALTPCLVQSGSAKSFEKKKRRVTISNIIEKASVSYTDSTASDSRLSPGKFSPGAGCSYSSLTDGDISGSPVHFFETTNTEQPDPVTAPPKTKIIYPKPGPDGLRRSQRVRLHPLEWYKNEHVIYQRRKSGNFVIAGIQPSKEAEYIAADLEKKKRRAKQRLKQTKTSKVSRSKLLSRPNLSLHQELPTELDYTIHSELPVINPDTQDEVLVDCVAPVDNTLYVGSGGDSPREGEPYIICHAIQQPTFTAGHLLLAPLAEKPTQMLSENTLIFTIVHGKLSVTIHRGSTVLEAGDQFFVPRGNTYCVKNLRNEEAKLSFVNLIEEDGS